MCGIIGYVGHQKALPILMKGLECLEYRGYDSAGIACLNEDTGRLFLAKEKGKIHRLKSVLNGKVLASTVGIAHTRWATHGVPSVNNAHPHMSGDDIALGVQAHPLHAVVYSSMIDAKGMQHGARSQGPIPQDRVRPQLTLA